MDFIPKKAILCNLKSRDKRGAIQELIQTMRKVCDGEKFVVADIVEAVMQREKIGTTGVGRGVGVPHAKLDGVKGVIGAFGRSPEGLDFSAVDGEPVHLVFVILSPPSRNDEYIRALQKVMNSIKRPNFLKFLKIAKTAKEIEDIFREVEEVAPV